MFDGVPDQFHQFITPRTSQPLHLPFPLHASGTPNTTFPSNFDPYNNPSHQLPLQPNNLLQDLHHVTFWVSSHKKIIMSNYVWENLLGVIQYIQMSLIQFLASHGYNIVAPSTLTSPSLVMTNLRKPNTFHVFNVLWTKFNGFFGNVPFQQLMLLNGIGSSYTLLRSSCIAQSSTSTVNKQGRII